jgi:hypothetical protein
LSATVAAHLSQLGGQGQIDTGVLPEHGGSDREELDDILEKDPNVMGIVQQLPCRARSDTTIERLSLSSVGNLEALVQHDDQRLEVELDSVTTKKR